MSRINPAQHDWTPWIIAIAADRRVLEVDVSRRTRNVRDGAVASHSAAAAVHDLVQADLGRVHDDRKRALCREVVTDRVVRDQRADVLVGVVQADERFGLATQDEHPVRPNGEIAADMHVAPTERRDQLSTRRDASGRARR